MMLNQMPAGRPEPQWTKYYAGNAFEDCEWRVEEMEILGVKQRYIMIRGTIMRSNSLTIDMPEGVNIHYPFSYDCFVIQYVKRSGNIQFWTTNGSVSGYPYNSINFNNMFSTGSRFLLFARVK